MDICFLLTIDVKGNNSNRVKRVITQNERNHSDFHSRWQSLDLNLGCAATMFLIGTF
jgi:hypothetical protein